MDPRRILRIARWEVTRNAGGVDRDTAAAVAMAVLAVGVVAGVSLTGGAGPGALESGIYRVGVAPSSPYHAPATADPAFVVRPPEREALFRGEQELVFVGTQLVAVRPTSKGRAAQSAFRESVGSYNEGLMRRDDNETAAYPVHVSLSYAEQRGVDRGVTSDTGRDTGGDSGGDGGTSGDGTGTGTGDAGTGEGGGGTGGAGSGGLRGIATRLTGGATSGTPGDIEPPFPFASLLLAFVYLVPMNFLVQAYGSTMLSERLERRGELLLVSPATRTDIVAGKTLPYALAGVGVVAAITAALRFSGVAQGGGPLAVFAVVPLVLLFLGATFCGAMMARSFKELTFVTVTITVGLTSYAFVPAIFTEVTPIALISPLTLVVRDLQGQAVDLGAIAFSTAPPTFTALVLFGLGGGLYREEDMFTQRSVPGKAVDALAARIASPWSAAKLSVLLLPFAFVAELVAVAMLFPVVGSAGTGGGLFGATGAVVLVLVVAVVIEEVTKSVHLYAGFVREKYDRGLRSALVVGALSGLGFFVAEKFVLLARLVGLGEIETAQAAMVTGMAPEGVPFPLVVALFLLAPLALHATTAAISSLGARRDGRAYLLALLAAMGVHLSYNLAVVSLLA